MTSPAARLRQAMTRIDEVTRGRRPGGTGHADADDEIGTIATDDALGFDPMPLLGCLDGHGADVVVIGQVAGILHGSTDLTGDLDLLWSGREADAPAISAAFAAAGAALLDDDGDPLAVGVEAFGLPKVLFRTATSAGDCCTPALPWGGLDVGAFMDRADTTTVDGVTVRYVSIEDLIAMREAVGRPKDLRRAAELRQLVR